MKYVGHSEYGRSPLDNYTMYELIEEVERRKERIEKREKVKRVIDDISEHIENAEVIGTANNSEKVIYSIEVRK